MTVNVWGYIAYDKGIHLNKISHNFNSKEYESVLIKEFGDGELGKEFVLLQDNCALHTGESSREFFSSGKIYVLKTSPVSPDLNCIENIWSIIDRKLKNYLITNFINTEDDLFKKVVEFANSIPNDVINKLIDSTVDRMRECNELKGKATHY